MTSPKTEMSLPLRVLECFPHSILDADGRHVGGREGNAYLVCCVNDREEMVEALRGLTDALDEEMDRYAKHEEIYPNEDRLRPLLMAADAILAKVEAGEGK